MLLQDPVLAWLTDEKLFDLCQHNPILRLERMATHDITAMPPANSEFSRQSGRVSTAD